MCGLHVTCDFEVALARRTLDVFAVEDEVIFVDAASFEDGHGSDSLS
jgi:hypothetical protein